MSLRLRRLLVPAASTALLLAVLVSLGVWQVARLHWKTGLLADIDRAEASPAIPLPAHPRPFEKVRVEGSFLPDASARYGADVRDTPGGPLLGAQLLMLLRRSGALPVLVDRGWAPNDAAVSTPTGAVAIEGYVRAPEHPGLFSAADDPARHLFYTLDPTVIARALQPGPIAPFTLIALQPGAAGGPYPWPATQLPRPPNDHLSYAITWFGLAAVLAGMFAAWSAKVLRA